MKDKNEIEKMNAVCFWLIGQCLETNAEKMKITQDKVTFHGEDIGDWEIIVRKKEKAPPVKAKDV